ncbi:MAG TPA: (2Fe-2S)-binding protein [Streptosporangiaceae bacterium]|nr:(2Fe-2S)-binding protein [Streptosporangiaceae bacterium]
MTGQPVTPATVSQIAAARTAANALGLYFRLQDPTAPGPAGGHGGWRPAALLYEPGTGGRLDELLDAVQARLGGCERRVAASLFYQGYAARLLSPQLGCLATSGCLPALPTGQLSWREPATEMIQLGLPPSPGWQGPAEPLLTQLLVQSFTAHLEPLATAIRARVHLSADVFTGNAASALISGLRLLDHQLADGWRPLATRALADPLLHGSGTMTATEPAFIRRSCCLYYRTQSGGLCGDCPLN